MEEEIKKCIDTLKRGGIILYPTDTIWGLGCDATNAEAVSRIYKLKKRSESKSMITLVSDDGMLQRYVSEVPEIAWDLIDLSDKPITIVYTNPKGIAKNVIAEDHTIGIRLVKEGFCNKLVHKFNKPIISTSANKSNSPSPINFPDIDSEIIEAVDFVVNPSFGTGNKKASSIIKLGKNGEIQIIRK